MKHRDHLHIGALHLHTTAYLLCAVCGIELNQGHLSLAALAFAAASVFHAGAHCLKARADWPELGR